MKTNVEYQQEEQLLWESLVKAGVPVSLRGGLVRFVLAGIRPRSFLSAVLANDLISAVTRADDETSIEDLRAVTRWIYNDSPSQCHGSAGIVADWVAKKAREFGVTK